MGGRQDDGMGNASRLGGESRRALFHGWMRRIANRCCGRAAAAPPPPRPSSSGASRISARSCGRRSSMASRCRRSIACRRPSLAVSTQTLAVQPSVVPVSYAPAPVARPADLGDTRIVPASYPVATAPATTARPVRARQVVYDDPVRAEKPQRSVKKSVIIIGSSAGVGAGVGAAVGGKKGALVGALIGGGGATLWDQLTRRK